YDDFVTPVASGTLADDNACDLTGGTGGAATQLVNVGDTAGQGFPEPDLLGIVPDTSAPHLDYFANSGGAPGSYCADHLTTPPPASSTPDWTNWTISAVQLATGPAMFLWNPTTGALYLWEK